ncbi:MAG: transcription antitermination factor NusB [Candidatus Tectomicrobia bacterium]|nr:transcription antitermination factor NusB [Candidatus Tectomicrobia bacterium]
MATRRRGREAALQLLYAIEITHADAEEVLESSWAHALTAARTREFTGALLQGVVASRDEIDAHIREWSANWSLERIGLVERNILRVAIYELLFMPEIPPNVTINEAIEVAKRYGAEDAPSFVNGILDRIKNQIAPSEDTPAVASDPASLFGPPV